LLGRWLNGSGKAVYISGGAWGEYMKKNDLLTDQVFSILNQDASQRQKSGDYNLTTHAEIENGYGTGYEMLHGTNRDVGDFQIAGNADYQGNRVVYNLTFTWNDKIDPNFTYGGDKTASDLLHKFYDPKDYDIHITWTETYIVNLIK
jgi:hypothetical protein